MPAERELTAVDCLAIARSFAWVVNESLVAAADKTGDTRLVLSSAKFTAAMNILDKVLAADVLNAVPVTAGLPPGKNGAVVKLYELVLAQAGRGSVCIGESALSVAKQG